MGNDAVSLYILIESLKYKQSRKKTQNGTSLLLSYFCRFQKIISLYFMEMHTPHIKRALTYAMICQTGTRTFWSWASFSDILGVTFCFHLTPPGQSETMVVS